MPNQFSQYGNITPEGQRVIQYMEAAAQVAEGQDIEALNALSGPVKHYYVNVTKLHLMTPARWLEDYTNAAQAIMRNLTEAETAQAVADADKQERAALAESLEEVKAALALAMAKIAQLEAEGEAADAAAEMAGEESAPPADEPAPDTRRGKRS